MKLRFLNILMVVIIGLTSAGCAGLRDKFIRKPKEEETGPVRYYSEVHAYANHPTLDLYTKRYIYWKSWHEELLDVLNNSNKKKKTVAVEQEISNLLDMQNMLVDEKADELGVYIDELTEIEQKLKNETITPGNEVRIRKKLETLGRGIKGDFSYNKMGDYIRSEFRK